MLDPHFREHFTKRREIFLNSLVGSVKSFHSVVCRPVTNSFSMGWQFEKGDTEHPWSEEGPLEFGLTYLKHMIDQGFSTAYAVSERSEGFVYLKAWEDEEPPWPDDNQIVMFATWEPMRV